MKTMIRGCRSGLLVLVMGLFLAACDQKDAPSSQSGGAGDQVPPRAMTVMDVQRQDIALNRSYPAKLRSDDEVTLVARVTGFLEARHFEPGQQVTKGESLYSIEPELYRNAVTQREADLASARAELSRAQRDAGRFEQLLKQNSVSRQQYDQALATREVASAQVAQAQAALMSANLDLGYANVTAPVSGVISLGEVNLGNLVTPGSELAVITPLDPLEVRFQLPQSDAVALRRQRNEHPESEIHAVLDLPGQGVNLEGKLDYLGSRVSEGTSTVQGRAAFANPDGVLMPGQFVRVVLNGLKRFDVIAVPSIAVTQGLMGPQVFVLDEENVARVRNIQLGAQAGAWQLVVDGLEPNDRVVVQDPAGLNPGTPIKPQPFDGDAAALMPGKAAVEQSSGDTASAAAQGAGAAKAEVQEGAEE
ncbi:efflux RND transporter periplasmic adaptor subunit [Halomonas halocynthiae]|uniref:efflux RND transporter periplasmic adaptor subunit n=1 Tax=Halomonas halocynthiae TaxID=176290 RepID=UPI0003FEF0C3|nr:efflux RND transporter periplasmic adaptor subunit [Halomonas halocynthiae]